MIHDYSNVQERKIGNARTTELVNMPAMIFNLKSKLLDMELNKIVCIKMNVVYMYRYKRKKTRVYI